MKYAKIATLFFSIIFSGGSIADDCFTIRQQHLSNIRVCLGVLSELPKFTVKTSTIYTPVEVFEGVKIKDLFDYYKVHGTTIRAFAWDDYSYSMPVDEINKYDVIIAFKRNGTMMDVSSLGPFAIVYPEDLYPEMSALEANAKTVFQLKEIEVN